MHQVQDAKREVSRMESTAAQQILRLETQEQASVHDAAATKLRAVLLNDDLSEMARLKRSTNVMDHDSVHDLGVECKALGQHEVFWQEMAQKNQEIAQLEMEQVEEIQEQSLKDLLRLQQELDQARSGKETRTDWRRGSEIFGDPERDSRYESLLGGRPSSHDRQVPGRQCSSEGQRPSGRHMDPHIPKRTASPRGQRPRGADLRGEERQENRGGNYGDPR